MAFSALAAIHRRSLHESKRLSLCKETPNAPILPRPPPACPANPTRAPSTTSHLLLYVVWPSWRRRGRRPAPHPGALLRGEAPRGRRATSHLRRWGAHALTAVAPHHVWSIQGWRHRHRPVLSLLRNGRGRRRRSVSPSQTYAGGVGGGCGRRGATIAHLALLRSTRGTLA